MPPYESGRSPLYSYGFVSSIDHDPLAKRVASLIYYFAIAGDDDLSQLILLYDPPPLPIRRPRSRDYELERKRLASQLEETSEHPLQALVSVS